MIESVEDIVVVVVLFTGDSYMIDGKIFITEGTWSYLERAINEQDRQQFEVIDVEKYGLLDDDILLL